MPGVATVTVQELRQMLEEFLNGKGFARVVSSTGGIEARSALIDPSVPRY